MYSHHYTSFGLLALLASNAFAAPHDDDVIKDSTAISATSIEISMNASTTCSHSMTHIVPEKLNIPASRRTKTMIVTVTILDEPGPATSLPGDSPTYTSTLDVSPPPSSLIPTGTQPTLVCPHPTEPCTISGIPIWPSGTTSLVLPSFTYEPLPTSMASGVPPSGDSTLPTETLGTSGSPTCVSTTCSHSMSHFVPGKSRLSAVEPPYTNNTMSATATSGSSVKTSLSVSTTCSHSMTHIIPGKSDIPASPPPTDASTPGVDRTFSTPAPATPTDISAPSMSTSTASLHSMTHIVPSKSAASFATPDSSTPNNMPSSKLPIFTSAPTPTGPAPSYPHPPRPSKEYYKARDLSNSTTLTWKTKYIKHAKTRRVEESKAEPRRKTYWSRFFAVAEKTGQCLACDEEGAVICLEKERYTWCKDGCVQVMKLGCDMVCKDGVIRGEGKYCVR
jgi:hypothetical protein